MATIILVRHGENEWVKEHKLAGWIPGIHLNENGREQAQEAAQRLSHLPVQALYSSPVERCMETAVYIAKALKLDIVQIEEVGEVRYGEWEGEPIKELAKDPRWHTVQFFPSRLQFPGGEALREVQFRAVQMIEQLSRQHEKETIVIVSHADLIKLVLAHYLGVHMDLFQRIVISPASINVFMLSEKGGVRILRLNDNGPLTIPTPPKEEKKQTENREEESKDNGPSN